MKYIIAAFTFFALFIGTLVTLCIRQDISLVSKNYYDEELAYQKQIEREQNTRSLTQKPAITYIDQVGIKIIWPEQSKVENGEVKVFCPSNSKLDQRFELLGATEQVFKMTATHGMFRVKLLWKMEGKDYYLEDQIII